MCSVSYLNPQPDPWLFRDISRWLEAMAAWEAQKPENVKARDKRRKWRKIHDYAAERYAVAGNVLAGRFWYGVMMRCWAKMQGWCETDYWRAAWVENLVGQQE